jgi:hypothetical protein
MRSIAVAFLFLWMAAEAQATVVLVDGQLDESDLVGTDTVGSFYYDAYDLRADVDTAISVSISSSDFLIYYGVWDEELFPSDSWIDDFGTEFYDYDVVAQSVGGCYVCAFSFDAIAGATYQIAVATQLYNPTALGAYDLVFSGDGEFTATTVPAPPTLLLMLTGLLGLGLARTRGVCNPDARVQ